MADTHIETIRNLAYLLGETYLGGRWNYFPITFALKTPLPALLLIVVALPLALRHPRRWWRELVLASLPASYFLLSLMNEINLGYRHLLPLVPFLYLFIARVPGHAVPQGGAAQSQAERVTVC